MCVCMLAAFDHVKAVNRAFSAFVIHHHVDVVTRDRASQIDRSRFVFSFRSEVDSGRGDVKALCAFPLHLVMLNSRRVFKPMFTSSAIAGKVIVG